MTIILQKKEESNRQKPFGLRSYFVTATDGMKLPIVLSDDNSVGFEINVCINVCVFVCTGVFTYVLSCHVVRLLLIQIQRVYETLISRKTTIKLTYLGLHQYQGFSSFNTRPNLNIL